nr:MAG TPA: hypothetical protein [Caudoviricetes sp.]
MNPKALRRTICLLWVFGFCYTFSWGLQKYNYFLNNQNNKWQNSSTKNNTLSSLK